MKKVIISVKDNVAEVFNDARVEINVASAIRSFTASVKDIPHKDDFTLYVIGEMDTNNGTIKPCEPVRVYSGSDVKLQVDATDGLIDTVTPIKAGGTQ
jgi:hypothetical protein